MPPPNKDGVAAARQHHAALEAFKAATDCLRPESGWMKLIRPYILAEAKKLHADIMKGDSESFDLYKADCAFHKLLVDLATLPERTREAQQAVIGQTLSPSAQAELARMDIAFVQQEADALREFHSAGATQATQAGQDV